MCISCGKGKVKATKVDLIVCEPDGGEPIQTGEVPASKIEKKTIDEKGKIRV